MFNFFRKNNCFSKNAALEDVFNLLGTLTLDKNIREDFLYKFKSLKNARKADIFSFVRLYMDWEDYLLTKGTLGTAQSFTMPVLRKKINSEVKLHSVDKSFGLIFEDRKEQFAYLSELFLYFISEYVIDNLGFDTLLNIHEAVAINDISEKIFVSKEGFDFSQFNREVVNERRSDMQQIVALFKVFFEVFSERIEVSFGAEITKQLFNDVYARLHKIYNSEMVSNLLVAIPERVLNLDEWLSMLSKSELEQRVKEETDQLEKLNKELEEKVEERTKELRKAYEDLKELDKRKSEFIFLVGHQMRTPLVAVKWALSLLKSGDAGEVSPSQKKIIEDAFSANESMNNVVNEILVADDIINNKAVYTITSVNIETIIKKVLEKVSQNALQRGVTFDMALNSKALVLIDEQKFEQVLFAIFDNAIRYSPPKSKVFVEFKDTENGASLSVKDSGIGIPQKVKDRIGERFFRADNALRQNTYGSGLGLYIAKKTIEAFGGKFDIGGEEGKGTTVTISLRK